MKLLGPKIFGLVFKKKKKKKEKKGLYCYLGLY